MPQLKNNHTIPKCLIKEWSIKGSNYRGVHVYELAKDKTHFSCGDGPRGYSFAIELDIYIAQKCEERIVAVEKWLSGVENILNIFLREVKTNLGKSLLKEEKDFSRLLLALFSLKHRSKHDLYAIRNFLLKNPDYKEKIGSDGEENMDVVVLENFINVTTEEALQFSNCELIICRNESGNLILGDRPFLINLFDGCSFLPVTPHYLVSIKKITEPSYYFFNNQALTDEMVDNFNRMIAENSREWIVASSEEQLQKYIANCKVQKEDATPYYEPVQKLLHGYKIR